MKYMGSKARLSKDIANILNREIEKRNSVFYDVFVGGFNLLPAVDASIIYANDICSYITTFYEEFLSGNFTPPSSLSEDLYNDIKNNKDSYPKPLVAFAGYACSFGGKFFGGYARSFNTKGEPRDHPNEQYRALIKRKKHLKDKKLIISNTCYKNIDIIPNSVVYCDPPYVTTTEYKTKFCHEDFYTWCENLVKEKNCSVYVSEYFVNRKGWEVVFSKKLKTNIRDKNNSTRQEKLYKVVL